MAQNNEAIDRHDFKLKGEAVAVLVPPGGTDFVPEGLLAALCDVPCQKLGGARLEGGGLRLCVACHVLISLVWGWRVAPFRWIEGSRAGVISNTGEQSELARAGY